MNMENVINVIKTLSMKNICQILPELTSAEIMSEWLQDSRLDSTRVRVLFQLNRSFSYAPAPNKPISNRYHAQVVNRIYNELWRRKVQTVGTRWASIQWKRYGEAAFNHFERNHKRYIRTVRKYVINEDTGGTECSEGSDQ